LKPGEVQIPCPKCGHPSFYFNTRKGVGYCHRAKCGWSPNRDQLQEKLGKRFQLDPAPQVEAPAPDGALDFPPDVLPLLSPNLVAHCEVCEETVQHIENDRHVPRDRQHHFGLRASENRIYIPVLENGALVNYVGRVKWWISSTAPRYQYASGVTTSSYLFTWDVFRTRDQVALVENTFNALWLRQYGVTTNFGSHLSVTQAEKIAYSRVRRVLILWDSGAEPKAEKAVVLLRGLGVSAAYVRLEGQPDGHREECLASIIQGGFEALQGGAASHEYVRKCTCVRGTSPVL